MEKYRDIEGNVWENYQAYCNSDVHNPNIIAFIHATNRRTPQNDYERELLTEFEELDRNDIPVGFD
jgi:hypothetical protein